MKGVFSRLQLLFAAGVATLVGSAKVQAKVLDGEVLTNLQRIEPYGFSYFPQNNAQAYLAFPSGDRSFGIALIIGDKRYQMQLEQGEVAIHDDQNNAVHIKRGGIIEVTASTKVVINAQDTDINGNLTITGTVKNNGKVIGVPHTHTSTSPGNPTSGVN